jgi:hypothetical protein
LIVGASPVQRIGRVAAVAQRLEPHRSRIHHQQPPDETLAEADDRADGFQRRHRADHAGERAECRPVPVANSI